MLARRTVIVVLVSTLGVVSGCQTPSQLPPVRDPAEVDGRPPSARRSASTQASLCFAGRSVGDDPYSSGGNSELAALCRKLPKLVRDVAGRDAPYPFFRWDSDVDHALDLLVSTLDTDHDGGVTSADDDIAVNVVGFSWGGFNARDLIGKVETDRRFSPTRRRIERFFALDPYRTDALVFAKKNIQIPANVVALWEFRHTVAPERDCSRMAAGLIGPFTGRAPLCTGMTVCHDFDYSLALATMNVDHCDVPGHAAANVLRILSGEELVDAPPERAVARH